MNVNYSNYYMLHVWVLDDMEVVPDVFAGRIPCITGPGGAGTIRDDPDHWCHFGRSAPAAAAATMRTPRGKLGKRPARGRLARWPQHDLPHDRGDRQLSDHSTRPIWKLGVAISPAPPSSPRIFVT